MQNINPTQYNPHLITIFLPKTHNISTKDLSLEYETSHQMPNSKIHLLL